MRSEEMRKENLKAAAFYNTEQKYDGRTAGSAFFRSMYVLHSQDECVL